MNGFHKKTRLAAMLAAALVLSAAGAAQAATINILALGASNTNGRGVSDAQAWPAQLEKMLRAKGYDAHVTVNAINRQTSAQILQRAGSIPAGTQVVVFDNGGDNDRKKGLSMAETNANVAKIVATIRAHHAVPIRAPYKSVAGAMYASAGYQADGHHLSPQSHARVAAALVPRVLAAVRK